MMRGLLLRTLELRFIQSNEFWTLKGKEKAMKTYGGVKVYLHIFLAPALNGGVWSV
jgi:hypothetical protein